MSRFHIVDYCILKLLYSLDDSKYSLWKYEDNVQFGLKNKSRSISRNEIVADLSQQFVGPFAFLLVCYSKKYCSIFVLYIYLCTEITAHRAKIAETREFLMNQVRIAFLPRVVNIF